MERAILDELLKEEQFRTVYIGAFGQVFHISAEQRRLTEKYLSGKEADLTVLFRNLRDRADHLVLEKYDEDQATFFANGKNWSNYPTGFCCDITDAVDKSVTNDDWVNFSPIDLVDPLQQFQRHGGFIHKVYGIVKPAKKREFQNAIQLGAYLIDVARDTGNVATDKMSRVGVYSEPGIPFKAIRSFTEFAEVCEEYYKYQIFPTYPYFKILPAFIPYIAVMPGGAFHFPVFHGLYFENILNNFRMSEDFLVSSKFGSRRLAEIQRRRLMAAFSQRQDFFATNARNLFPLHHLFEYVKKEYGDLGSMNPEKRCDYLNTIINVEDGLDHENSRLFNSTF